jgi:hypothetical protein
MTIVETLREIAVYRMAGESTDALTAELARSQRVRLDENEATTEHFLRTADE